MILLVGATGQLGGKIAKELVEEMRPAVGLVRSDAGQRACELMRLSSRRGDLTNPASLSKALEGIEVVVCSATAMARSESIEDVDRRGIQNLIRAATAAKVGHFVFVSFPKIESECPLQTAKREAEETLSSGKMPYTILRPWFFSANWVWGDPFGYSRATNRFEILGSGEQRNSWVSLGDVARVVARVAGNKNVFRKTLEFGGPDPLSPRAILADLKRYGVDPKVVETPLAKLEEAVEKSRKGDPKEHSIHALRLEAGRGRVLPTEPLAGKFPTRVGPEIARSLRPVPAASDLNFRVDDLVIAYGSASQYSYLHVPVELYTASPMPAGDPVKPQIDPIADAAVVATLPVGASGVQTAYVNLEKLIRIPEDGPQLPRAKVQPGSDAKGWQVVLRQGPPAVPKDSLFLLTADVLKQCSEFPSHEVDATEILDTLVDERTVVAWMPEQTGSATGCVCILLNLTSLADN